MVASRITGVPELVEDGRCGYSIEPGDAQGLADTLERLSYNRTLREWLGRAARLKVASEVDLDTNSAPLVRCFAEQVCL